MGRQKGECRSRTEGVCASCEDERHGGDRRLEVRSGAGGLISRQQETFRNRLAEFDGKAITILGEARTAFAGEPDYPQWLVEFCGDDDWRVSAGSTWLLRQYLERDGKLSGAQTGELVRALNHLSHWSSQLHLCQSMRHLEPDAGQAGRFAVWLEEMFVHRRPFIRAWALDGLVALAGRFPEFSATAAKALAAAEKDEAASVRARARNLK